MPFHRNEREKNTQNIACLAFCNLQNESVVNGHKNYTHFFYAFYLSRIDNNSKVKLMQYFVIVL